MEGLKGPGKTVVIGERDAEQVELVLYADQSLGIRRNGRTIGVWEWWESDDCFRTFAQLLPSKPDEPLTVVIAQINSQISPFLN
jgi:hypothetical protein